MSLDADTITMFRRDAETLVRRYLNVCWGNGRIRLAILDVRAEITIGSGGAESLKDRLRRLAGAVAGSTLTEALCLKEEALELRDDIASAQRLMGGEPVMDAPDAAFMLMDKMHISRKDAEKLLDAKW